MSNQDIDERERVKAVVKPCGNSLHAQLPKTVFDVGDKVLVIKLEEAEEG